MRNIFICSMLLMYATYGFCQQTQLTKTPEEYLKLSRSQKAGGFVLLGLGAITLTTAALGDFDFDTLGIVVVIGSAFTLTSIPLFIAASRNKKKAKKASLGFKFERIQKLQPMAVRIHSIPGISLRLNL